MANTQFSKPWRWLSLPIGTHFEIVAADIFGPLRPTSRGHTHILVLIDHHTRRVELIALPESAAELVAEAIFEQWMSRWGTMRALLTDNWRPVYSPSLTAAHRHLWDQAHLQFALQPAW